jgi:alkylation response protein AidB-like acyl-CoA dehydrogenase
MNMSASDDSTTLRPEEFAEAAEAPIEAAKGRALRDAARVLAEAGLIGVSAAEADGGLGLPIDFALPIVEAAGRLQLRFPLVEQILLAKAFGSGPTGEAGAGTSMVASALAAGDRSACIAWQGSVAEGVAGHARHAPQCDWVLVADEAPAGESILSVPGFRGGASLLEVASSAIEVDAALDPDVPVTWMQLQDARVVARLSPEAFAQLCNDACILLAGFVTGAAQGAIARTATYVGTRVQFGRPLSAKQAVRHWMSRMQLVSEVSAAATRRVLARDEYGNGRDPRPSFAGAISNATFVLEKAMHLHGGMGFTWEMPLHHSLRDIRAIDAFCGNAQTCTQIGQRFIEAA